jgi:hypothetical protein
LRVSVAGVFDPGLLAKGPASRDWLQHFYNLLGTMEPHGQMDKFDIVLDV